uniref:Beta-ketoacyl-[acyl-carrier-protein] synthase III n=1 Tax=Gelidium gabrielsonii TaxID=2483892 RepID=A0A3G2QXE1_9FLOR|nr:3-oxoacyl-acyl-carrier-protein synthase 3 [Gelidium gabrielsonii]AYO27720.1 3-oxoacyl-acyl-carrier-protein synthase 3 [Gelidium gabrielsonii]
MTLLSKQGASIIATGSAVPELCINNHEISKVVETSDEWIVSRTGIKERRILNGINNSITDLATLAAMRALNRISMDPLKIDLIILATSSPNDLFGSASQIQANIGAYNAAAFDITAACSGFIISLTTATQFIENGVYNNILVIGADALSKWTDWSDRSTCILFGDGAGAIILQSCLPDDKGILGFQLNTNGQKYNQLCLAYKDYCDTSNSLQITQGAFNKITMNGREVYKFAVSQVPESIEKCLCKLNIPIEEINWIILHQANKRILEAVANKLIINNNKFISNLDKYGNTSAASIPLVLDEAVGKQTIQRGQKIIISGFGAGLTWGTIAIKWKY